MGMNFHEDAARNPLIITYLLHGAESFLRN